MNKEIGKDLLYTVIGVAIGLIPWIYLSIKYDN